MKNDNSTHVTSQFLMRNCALRTKFCPLTDAQHPSLGPEEESDFRQGEEEIRDGGLAATKMYYSCNGEQMQSPTERPQGDLEQGWLLKENKKQNGAVL